MNVTLQVDKQARARRNRILGIAHALLAIAFLAGFVIAQSYR